MNLKEINFKKIYQGRNSIVIALLLYLLITLLIVGNLEKVLSFRKQYTDPSVVEAVVYPKGVGNVLETFYADPLLSSTENDSILDVRKNISALLFSSLFKENPDGTLRNDLIDTYNFEQGYKLTIKIREDVFWHDNEHLKIDDVIFTLDLIRSIGQSSLYYGAANGGSYQIQKTSDYEATILLQEKDQILPNAEYLFELKFPVLPMHILQHYSQNDLTQLSSTPFGKKPIGSGMFEFDSTRGTELEMQLFNQYYAQKPPFKHYIIRYYKDEATIARDFSLKNIDLYTTRGDIENQDVVNSLHDSGFEFNTILKNINYVLYFNLNEKKEDRPKLIKSISLRNGLLKVLNRTKMKDYFAEKSRIVYGPIDQTSWAFSSEVETEQQYNLEEFTKRATALGYTKSEDYFVKDGEVLGFTLTYLGGGVRDEIVQLLQDDFKLAGIKVTLDRISTEGNPVIAGNIIESRTLSSVISSRNFEALLTSVNQNQDPDRNNMWNSSQADAPGQNISSFDSMVADLMLAQGKAEFDLEKRKEKYIRFQRTFIQDVPAIYLLNAYTTTYYSKRLNNVELEVINEGDQKYMNISSWELE